MLSSGSRFASRRSAVGLAGFFASLVLVAAACSSAATTAPSTAATAVPPAATATPMATAAAPASAAPAASAAAVPANPNLILATTTSLQDSGLLDVLVPAFEKQSGYTVKPVAVGSGQAMTMGKECNADVLFVHSPTQEQAFMDAGSGVDRRLVANNYFWIVGPASDPAKISGTTSAVDAFKKIADSQSTFVTRGDNSGTNTKELALWKSAGIQPKGSWYLESGQGMGPTLQIASEKNGYTLTDTATFLANKSKLDLQPLLKTDKSLINIYSVIGVNPAKCPKVNAEGAKAWEDYVTSPAGQQIIGSFGTATVGQTLFTADAGKAYADLTK